MKPEGRSTLEKNWVAVLGILCDNSPVTTALTWRKFWRPAYFLCHNGCRPLAVTRKIENPVGLTDICSQNYNVRHPGNDSPCYRDRRLARLFFNQQVVTAKA